VPDVVFARRRTHSGPWRKGREISGHSPAIVDPGSIPVGGLGFPLAGSRAGGRCSPAMRTRWLGTLMVVVVAISLAFLSGLSTTAGCRSGSSESAAPLRISMIPTTDPAKLLRDAEPLKARLGSATGKTIDFTIPTNYAAVVEALIADKLDIAYLGGFTYVQAHKRAGVEPLVQRDRDQKFHSVFVTAADSPIAQLSDLKGKSFAFGDVNSTSGHLMPEYFMRQTGVDAEVIAKAIYTGGHDATLLAIANKKVDAGALDESVFQKMTKDGKVDPTTVRIFWVTPPFFDYVWVARKGLAGDVKERVASMFLGLDAGKPEDKPLLDLLAAAHYVRARDEDYEKLRQAATQAGLLK
jgi:phosphonate transport system substrate-binding protein